ncbi:putative DNA-binding domain-containing protein [Serratia rubidaea]|uniref:DNA-binding domain-containing protein n=1 Tax=Serratia rubidaea TaxID=61652 RepID=A0ABS0MFS7_SERRU|nr:putative DNA-binding domain-containing protein [Serratia rubidaea]
MTSQHRVPASLAAAEAEFSGQLRSRHANTYSKGMRLYRKIIRENIYSVLLNVFPLYCRQKKDEAITALIDAFLYQHQASQPEFHQIATELLLFMRQQPKFSDGEMALIEYEWLMYAVEIDDAQLPHGQRFSPSAKLLPRLVITLNPTLNMVALPFWLNKNEPCYSGEIPLHYYAIYRKRDNAVYQKKLNNAEVRLLAEINAGETHATLLQEKSSKYLPTTAFYAWLDASNNDELLSLTLKG